MHDDEDRGFMQRIFGFVRKEMRRAKSRGAGRVGEIIYIILTLGAEGDRWRRDGESRPSPGLS